MGDEDGAVSGRGGDEAADSAGALGSAAEVEAPQVAAQGGSCGVEFGDEVPTVVDESQVGGDGWFVVDGFGDALGDASALVVVAEFKFELAAAFNFGAAHFNQAILAVPPVVPAAVEEQVAVLVVVEVGASGGNVSLATLGVGGFAFAFAFAGVEGDGFDGCAGGVGDFYGAAEVGALAFGGFAVDGDGCVLVCSAGDVGDAGMVDGADLGVVGGAFGVADFGEVFAFGIGAVAGALAVADGVEGVLVLLPGDWCAVLPVALCGDHLTEVVVAVFPIAAVCHFDALTLVDGVETVVERLMKVAAVSN